MKFRKSLKIGITGGRGFVGSHIAALLKKKGAKLSFFDLPKDNLLKPGKNLENFVNGKDIIVHAAAVNRGTDTEVISGSVVAVYNLILAMEKSKSRAKIIFLSSIQAETETLYGKSKRLAEIILEDFSNRIKTPATVFRLTNVFGESCRPFYNSVVATFCYQIANGKELTVNPESRNKIINLIYVGEVVQILAKEALVCRKSLFYLKKIDSKNEINVADLAELIQSFKNKPKLKSKFEKDLYKTYLSYIKEMYIFS